VLAEMGTMTARPPWLTTRRMIGVGVVLALVVTAWLTVVRPASAKQFTAYFPQATKLHNGDKITVLDVKVGRVLSVTPQRDRVKVRIEVDADQKIPAGAHATIVAPTMVSVRHIELWPVYDGGRALADGAAIPISRTAVPVEWSEVQKQLTRLATALGPKGANRQGALSSLLDSSAANLQGQGEQLATTLTSMADALQTVSENRGNLFASVRNLDVFVKALSASDQTVRLFNRQLATVSQGLSSDSDVLVQALRGLGVALDDLHTFVDANRQSVVRSVAKVQNATHNLANHRQRLADILQSAPTALGNYYNIYYPDTHAMTGTFVGQNFDSPAVFICSSLYSLGGTPSQCESLLNPIAKYLKVPVSPIGINPLEKNGGSQSDSSPRPRSGANPQLPNVPQPKGSGSNGLDLLGGMMLGLTP